MSAVAPIAPATMTPVPMPGFSVGGVTVGCAGPAAAGAGSAAGSAVGRDNEGRGIEGRGAAGSGSEGSGAGAGAAAAPHPGGTLVPPSADESAEATTGSYLPVPMGTGLLGFAAFQAALKLWTAVFTAVPGCATDEQ